MSAILDHVLAANAAYADSFGEKSELALPPARGIAILTCMDARLDPAKYAGLSEGDAHVIRNAGGRASDDAIRSLVISYKLLGTALAAGQPGAISWVQVAVATVIVLAGVGLLRRREDAHG